MGLKAWYYRMTNNNRGEGFIQRIDLFRMGFLDTVDVAEPVVKTLFGR